jgi:hypothetical protein
MTQRALSAGDVVIITLDCGFEFEAVATGFVGNNVVIGSNGKSHYFPKSHYRSRDPLPKTDFCFAGDAGFYAEPMSCDERLGYGRDGMDGCY